MLKINKKALEGKWYDMPDDPDVRLFIVPFPFTRNLFDLIQEDEDKNENEIKQARIMFLECLKDWKGFVDDATDVPLECNKENKLLIFNNDFTIVNFVLEKSNLDENKVINQVKN